jgi:drug/metabolite transporter (DMT)-like permease
MSSPYGFLILGLFFLMTQLIVVCACFIYTSKSRSSAGMLMLVGSMVSLFSSMVSSASSFVQMFGHQSSNSSSLYLANFGIAGFGAILFAIGLLMMAQRTLPAEPKSRDDRFDR